MMCGVFARVEVVLALLLFVPVGMCPGQVEPSLACGDVNGDDAIDISDSIRVLRYLYLGGSAPVCSPASSSCGDWNGDGAVEQSDAVALLGWLFLGVPDPQCPVGCEGPAIEGFTFIECNAQGYPEYKHDATGIVFVRLPGGNLQMGSPEGEPYHQGVEGPVHEVTLSPFLIAKYELTQGEWAAVMGNYPSHFDGTMDGPGNPVNPPVDRDRLPVEQVSWDDIQEFEAVTGLALPTEAQWEYACRGGSETAFSFGSGESCSDWGCAPCLERDAYLWYCPNATERTHEVGTKPPNPFGLHDMHGNVYEWCEDVYNGDFYSTPEAAGLDPLCTSGSVLRVCRGGSWRNEARNCCSASRSQYFPVNRRDHIGLRPAFYPLP